MAAPQFWNVDCRLGGRDNFYISCVLGVENSIDRARLSREGNTRI